MLVVEDVVETIVELRCDIGPLVEVPRAVPLETRSWISLVSTIDRYTTAYLSVDIGARKSVPAMHADQKLR
jgi:hypothetical protein